jgi:hypothetical protein
MQPHLGDHPTDRFPTDPSGRPEAGRPALLELAHGDTLDLHVGPVAKRLGETTVGMLAYNGSIPGPTLKLRQGSEIVVQVENQGDPPAPGWFERPFGKVGLDQFALDLRIPAPPPVRRWLERPVRTRGLPDGGPGSSMAGGSLAQWFDVMVHRQALTPAPPA